MDPNAPVAPQAPSADAGQPVDDIETRVSALESKVDQILAAVTAKTASDDKDEDDDEKKSADLKKEGEGEKVKLPVASAGETDESAKPETDKTTFADKSMETIVEKAVSEVLKSMGLKKTAPTPRPSVSVDIKKASPVDPVFQRMKDVQMGKKTVAQMNQEIKKGVSQEWGRRMEGFSTAKAQHEQSIAARRA